MMSNKATIEIDADVRTVSVILPDENWLTPEMYPLQTTKAELVAMILAIQSEKLMVMTTQELKAQYLIMIRNA